MSIDSAREEGAFVQVGVRGILNVMKHLKMIPGEIEEQTGILVIHGNYEARNMTIANRAGLVHRLRPAANTTLLKTAEPSK